MQLAETESTPDTVTQPAAPTASGAERPATGVRWGWQGTLALAVCGVVALGLSIPVMRWDEALSRSIRAGDVPGDVRKAIELSEAFAHGTGVAAILGALLLAAERSRRGVWVVAVMTILSGGAANLAKAIFTRARPYTYDNETQTFADVTGWQFLGSGSFWDASQRSFPSGHTATAWALALGLCLLFPRASVLFVLLAALATYQRLFSGAHFPSDTLAGFGIACLACAAVLWVPRFRQALCTARS